MFTNDETLEVFITGLKNAHAMENQALSIMKPQAGRLEHYPDMRERLEAHIAETEGQIERLDTILEDLQERHSSLKNLMLSVGGSMAALSHAAAGDEVLKDTFANYAFEHYEIAAYKSLLAMCEQAATQNIASLLRESLSEEERMAQWIGEHVKPTTERYIALRVQDATAKR